MNELPDEPEEEPAEEAEEPKPGKKEKRSRKDVGPIEAVYAGPEYFAPEPPPVIPSPGPQDPSMFMCVYAGPEMMSNPAGPWRQPGQFGPPVAPEQPEKSDADDKTGLYCPDCGAPWLRGAKFCPECGTPSPYHFCKSCGTLLLKDAPFCHECGKPVEE